MAVCSDDHPRLPLGERGTLADARFRMLTGGRADARFATNPLLARSGSEARCGETRAMP